MIGRWVVAALVAAALLAACGTATARADTQPSLWATLQRVDTLSAQLRVDHAALLSQQAAVNRTAGRLQRAADRVARLEASLAGARVAALGDGALVDQMRARLVEGDGLRAAQRRLRRVQRQAEAGRALPQLAAIQRRSDRLSAERRRDLALARALSGVAPPAPAAGSALSREAWASLVLRSLHAPICANNLVSLVTWQTAESTTAAWNPLATTQPADGATDYNAVGVKNYPSAQAGVSATIATLRGGYTTQGYGWILYRLATCADPDVTAQAINASNWCRGCAGGAYVTGMVDEVRADYAAYANG